MVSYMYYEVTCSAALLIVYRVIVRQSAAARMALRAVVRQTGTYSYNQLQHTAVVLRWYSTNQMQGIKLRRFKCVRFQR